VAGDHEIMAFVPTRWMNSVGATTGEAAMTPFQNPPDSE
jgi:hypothetical protein